MDAAADELGEEIHVTVDDEGNLVSAKTSGMPLQLRISGIGGSLLEVSVNRNLMVAHLKQIILRNVPSSEKRIFYISTEMKNTERLSAYFHESVTAADLTPILRSPGESDWLRQVRSDGMKLLIAPEEMRHNREVVLAAISQCVRVLEFVPMELRADAAVALEAVKAALTRKQQHYRTDFELFRWVLQHVAPSLHNDAYFTLNALEAINNRQDPRVDMVMSFAADDLCAHRTFIDAALSYTPRAVIHASDELRCDQEFLLDAIARNFSVFGYVPVHLRSNKEFRNHAEHFFWNRTSARSTKKARRAGDDATVE